VQSLTETKHGVRWRRPKTVIIPAHNIERIARARRQARAKNNQSAKGEAVGDPGRAA